MTFSDSTIARVARKRKTFFWAVLVALTQLFFLPTVTADYEKRAAAQDEPSSSIEGFIRFHKIARAKATLDTSVSIYRHPENGRVLSLVGAVHVADPSYFRAIQEELDRYDLVLFERVGTPDEKRDEKLAARLSLIGELQIELASLLEFAHQSGAIDYSRENLRHADLSMAEFNARLEARGEPLIPAEGLLRFLAPFMKMSFAMTRSMREMDPQLTNRLRWQMARTMSDMSRLLEQLGIEDHENPDDVIIGVRNDHAWEVFHDSFPEGHQRIAIFYGAAHLPDFQRRLLEEGWKLEERRWVPAWNIPVPEKEQAEPVPAPLRPRQARL